MVPLILICFSVVRTLRVKSKNYTSHVIFRLRTKFISETERPSVSWELRATLSFRGRQGQASPSKGLILSFREGELLGLFNDLCTFVNHNLCSVRLHTLCEAAVLKY